MPELGGFCNYCFNNRTCKSRIDIDFSCATLSLFFEHSLKEKIVKYAEKSFKYTLIRKFKNEPIFYLVLNVHEDGDFLILFCVYPTVSNKRRIFHTHTIHIVVTCTHAKFIIVLDNSSAIKNNN